MPAYADAGENWRLFRPSLVLFGVGAIKAWQSFNPFESSPNDRVIRYIDISSVLYKYCPDCSLVTSEIGGIGYGFKGVVYDGFGFADPEAIIYHPMNVPSERQSYFTGAIPKEYIYYRNPDFILSMPVFTIDFRKSEYLNQYKSYLCPFNDGLTIWGDEGVLLHADEKLPKQVMNKASCKPISMMESRNF